MPKKLKVELELQDKLSKSIDIARQKVVTFGHNFDRMITKVTTLKGVAGAVAFGFIGKMAKDAIDVSAKMEVFAKQLEMVKGNANSAALALNAIREFARTSPLETEDVVQSYVRLRAVGIDPTMEQMKTLGGVAVMMNIKLTDLLDAFIGMNKRTLRSLGIEIDRTGSKAIIESGNMRRVVEKDSGSIRKALLEIWESRFPDAINKAANTTVSKTEIMKSNVHELAAAVGDKLKPAWDAVIVSIGNAAEAIRKIVKPNEEESVAIAQRELETLKAKKKIIESTINKTENSTARAKEAVTWIGEANKKTIESLNKQIEAKRQEILKLTFQAQKLRRAETLGVGDLGGVDDEEKEKGKRIVSAIYEGYAIGLEQREKLEKEAAEKSQKITEEMIKDRLEIVKQLRIVEIGEDKYFYEQQLNETKLAYERGILAKNEYEILITDITKREMKRRLELQKEEIWATINSNMRLGSALTNLANVGLQNSKIAAKKRQNILVAMAVAEGAASAVTAAKAGWDTGITYYDKAVLAAAGAIEAIAIAAGQIATIKSQKFARGTSFAPGGRALVGEEGPEMAEFPRGTRIRTAAETRQFFGGTTISPTIIINGNADGNTVSQIQKELNSFGKKFTQAIRTGNIDLKQLGIVTR